MGAVFLLIKTVLIIYRAFFLAANALNTTKPIMLKIATLVLIKGHQKQFEYVSFIGSVRVATSENCFSFNLPDPPFYFVRDPTAWDNGPIHIANE